MTSLAAPAGLLAREAVRPVLWRYHFTDFRLGRLLATLPMSGVKLDTVLSGASSASGVVSLSSEAIRRRDPFTATIPRRSCLWAERQELDPITRRVASTRLMWGGIVMARARSHAARSMKITAVSWESYLQRRLSGSSAWTQRDKFLIMRWLISEGFWQDYATGIYTSMSPHTAGLDYGLSDGPSPPVWNSSGVLADRTYVDTDLKPVLENCKELASSGAGFDWRLVPEFGTPGDLSTMRIRLDLGYPRLGRTAPPDLRWSTDPADVRQRWGYVDDLTISEDGSGVHNRVTALGEGTGPNQLRAVADSSETTRNEAASGYPLYETSLGSSTQDLRTQDSVTGHARGALLSQLSSEVQISGVKVRGDLNPTLTMWDVGDDATVRVGQTTTGSPTTIVGQVVARSIQPPGPDSTERVTFDVQGTAAA